MEAYATGERVVIWITGLTHEFSAEVVEGGSPERPYLRVAGLAQRLKPGDYIIRRRVHDP